MGWLIMGIIFVIGGLSGQMVLRGTNSSWALAVVGGIMVVIGIISLGARAKADGVDTPRRSRRAPGGRQGGRRSSSRYDRDEMPQRGGGEGSRTRRRNPGDSRPRAGGDRPGGGGRRRRFG